MHTKRNTFIGIGLLLVIIIIGIFVSSSRKRASVTQDVHIVIAESSEYDGSYLFDLEKSLVVWEGKKTLIVDYVDQGIIRPSKGEIEFDNGLPVSGSVTFDMSTISAVSTGQGGGESMLSNHLKSADFFDVEQYPESRFIAKRIESVPGENGAYVLYGDMTIKNTTLPIEIPASLLQVEQGVALVGSVALDRTLWDIRFGSGKFFQNLADNTIDDYFTISFSLVIEEK